MLCADGGLMPVPTLAENELVDVLRDVADAVLDDVEDDSDGIRGGPASAVAFTAGATSLELGGAAGFVGFVSPALSARVFLLGADSGTSGVSIELSSSQIDVRFDS